MGHRNPVGKQQPNRARWPRVEGIRPESHEILLEDFLQDGARTLLEAFQVALMGAMIYELLLMSLVAGALRHVVEVGAKGALSMVARTVGGY